MGEEGPLDRSGLLKAACGDKIPEVSGMLFLREWYILGTFSIRMTAAIEFLSEVE
jgi:hypothetical protein